MISGQCHRTSPTFETAVNYELAQVLAAVRTFKSSAYRFEHSQFISVLWGNCTGQSVSTPIFGIVQLNDTDLMLGTC